MSTSKLEEAIEEMYKDSRSQFEKHLAEGKDPENCKYFKTRETAFKECLELVKKHAGEERDDTAILEEIAKRDYWEEQATLLAYKVGELLGIDVGEHSSANCPVENAIIAIDEHAKEED